MFRRCRKYLFIKLKMQKFNNLFTIHKMNDTALISSGNLRQELHEICKNLFVINPPKSKLFIMLKIKFKDDSYASLTKLLKANHNELEDLIDSIVANYEMKMDKYNQKPASELLLNYKIKHNSDHIKSKIFYETENEVKNNFSYMGYDIPINTDLNKWGTIINNKWNTYSIKKDNSNIYYDVIVYSEHQEVSVIINNKVIFKFKDYFGINSNSFRRVIEKNEFFYHNGQEVFYIVERKTDKIGNLKPNSRFRINLWTIDIETKIINNIITPYCICIFNGKNSFSYYLTDFKNSEEMLFKAIQDLIIPKNNNALIYAHNLSNFDGIFILKVLALFCNDNNWSFEPILREGKIIELKISFKNGENTIRIKIRDSYLLLPSSLRKLAISFGVLEKSFFPHSFVNNNPLDYVGKTPNFDNWEGLTLEEYNQLKSNKWSLRDEAIKYCIQDCVTLHQIIYKFAILIFDRWKVNLNKYPTLPSLAFAIYRTCFMDNLTIPKITGQMYNDIKQAYTGGHTDTYIPYGEDLNHYDVNSLYPSVMAKYSLPYGDIFYFNGDILKFKPDAHGFFLCNITTPEDMNRPLLQTRVKTDNGFRTVAPLGTWTDWIYSEEIKTYEKYGYKFNIKQGYTFEKRNLFENYINEMYEIKKNTPKSDPMFLISKLLQNSLYGRLGMSPSLPKHSIVSSEIFNVLMCDENIDILDFTELDNDLILVSFISSNSNEEHNIGFNNNTPNINIAIAASITALSRVEMAEYLGNPNIKIWATDTDSIITDAELPTGNELGELKLEAKYKEATFIAPKVYGGILNDNSSFTKVKGYKNSLPYNELKSLLPLESNLELKQDKWIKNYKEGNIKIHKTVYSLKATDNKRNLIYKNNIFISTKPYIIDNNKIINKNNKDKPQCQI